MVYNSFGTSTYVSTIGSLSRGGKYLTLRDGMVENINLMIPNVGKDV